MSTILTIVALIAIGLLLIRKQSTYTGGASTKVQALAGGTVVVVKKMTWLKVPLLWLLTLVMIAAALTLLGWATWTFWLSPTHTVIAPVGQWSKEVKMTGSQCIRADPKTSEDEFFTLYRNPNNVWLFYTGGSPDMWGVKFKSADEKRPAEVVVTIKARGTC